MIPLLLLGLGAAGWVAVVQWEQWRTVTFVIPADTAAGQNSVAFPDEIMLTVGLKDTIVIENQDDELHLFGPFVVAPRSTVTKQFKMPVIYQGACTFHQDRQMTLVVEPAPWDRWWGNE